MFTNARNSQSFVRHGSTHADVHVTLRDGTSVRWEKGDKDNRYTLNGKVLDKVGAGCPDLVADACGVYPVKISDQVLWPQIAQQFSGQVFLINQSGAVIAEAISDADRVGRLNSCLRNAESDRRTTQQSIVALQAEQSNVTAALDQYEGLDAVRLQMDALTKDLDYKDKVDKGVVQYSEWRKRRDTARRDCALYSPVSSIGLPDLRPLQEAWQGLRDAERTRDSLRSLQEQQSRLAGVADLRLADLEGLLKDLRTLQDQRAQASDLKVRLVQASDRVANLSGKIPAIPDLNLDRLGKFDDAISTAQGFKSRIESADKQINTLRQSLDSEQTSLQDLQGKIHDMVGPECPLCGRQS